MFKVLMQFEGDSNWYFHSSWEDRNKANEVAMKVREIRKCDVWVQEVIN